MSALFFVAPARQSEAFSRREASPLGHEQAPVGCKNTKHEVRGIRGAKIGQMDSTCSIPGKKLETEYAKWKQRIFRNFHYGIEIMEIKWYDIFKRKNVCLNFLRCGSFARRMTFWNEWLLNSHLRLLSQTSKLRFGRRGNRNDT